jgi:hypothetical protein
MPKRGSDADSRIFFDELRNLTASRLKATGAIRLEDRHGVIAFGEDGHDLERCRCIGVAHTIFPNGGSWSYFICPRCGGRKKKLWLVDDAPRCLSCCWSLGVRYRSAMKTEPSANWRKRGWAHMPGFTPARTRYQLAGKLAMKPRTMPICIMNQ